jgi:DHA1 family bicyclomycin/chloramphenicol resistance-like MFS transporter
VVTNRQAMGYTLAMAAVQGALFGFINSSQQIFYDVFKAPALFTTVFAVIAGGIAIASIVNARIVVKLGSRKISHTALLGFTGMAAIHAAVVISGHETIWTFAILQAMTMFCFGLMAGNFGSMAMEPMGHIAGTASSAQGFISTIIGSLTGFAIGQQFNGTVVADDRRLHRLRPDRHRLRAVRRARTAVRAAQRGPGPGDRRRPIGS